MSEYRPAPGTLLGEWEPSVCLDDGPRPGGRYAALPHGARRLQRVLSPRDCARLVDALDQSGKAAPVNVTGHPYANGLLGSLRATAWSPELARQLWERVRYSVPHTRYMHDHVSTDWYALGPRLGHRRWRAVGLGPVLRFMRYREGGRHWAHYDMGFDYPDERRSLMSLVFYLTDAKSGTGGATRLLGDGQGHEQDYDGYPVNWHVNDPKLEESQGQ